MTNKTAEAPPPPLEEWLTPDQVARLLNKKSGSVVRGMVARGELAAGYPTGPRGMRIARSEYERFSAELKEQARIDAERRRRALAS